MFFCYNPSRNSPIDYEQILKLVKKISVLEIGISLDGTTKKINDSIRGERILDEIPWCKFYKNNRCVIQNSKPFDCLLYPVKILYEQEEERFKVVLSLDCPFVKTLTNSELLKLEDDITEFFDNLDGKLLGEYLSLAKEWDQITKPKSFPYKLLMYIDEESFSL